MVCLTFGGCSRNVSSVSFLAELAQGADGGNLNPFVRLSPGAQLFKGAKVAQISLSGILFGYFFLGTFILKHRSLTNLYLPKDSL